MEEISSIIVSIVFLSSFILIAVLSALSAAKKAKNSQNSRNNGSTPDVGYFSKATNKATVKKETETIKKPLISTIDFGKESEHEHVYDEAETFEKIVGSLGEVNDEGCAELDGLRLISKDVSYETEGGEREIDLNKIAGAIVFGEVIGKPRGINPYRYKR